MHSGCFGCRRYSGPSDIEDRFPDLISYLWTHKVTEMPRPDLRRGVSAIPPFRPESRIQYCDVLRRLIDTILHQASDFHILGTQ